MEPKEAPWQKVVTASDCDMCPLCDEPICPDCDSHYAQCDCQGLHEDPDHYEYCCIDWQWFIRPKHPEQPKVITSLNNVSIKSCLKPR